MLLLHQGLWHESCHLGICDWLLEDNFLVNRGSLELILSSLDLVLAINNTIEFGNIILLKCNSGNLNLPMSFFAPIEVNHFLSLFLLLDLFIDLKPILLHWVSAPSILHVAWKLVNIFEYLYILSGSASFGIELHLCVGSIFLYIEPYLFWGSCRLGS